jgi:hypothetical protein
MIKRSKQMNDRIEELAKQARAWAETAFKHQHEKFTSHWDNPVGYTVTQFFEQKFAELIIRECARAVDQVYEDAEPDHGCYDWATWAEGADVLKHFGVEK